MSSGIMLVGPPPGVERSRRRTGPSPVFLAILGSALLWPRVVILAFWVFGSQLGDAFSSWVIPAAGFIVAPWTTGAYAMMWSISSNEVSGWEWAAVALGVLLDVATWAGAARVRAR